MRLFLLILFVLVCFTRQNHGREVSCSKKGFVCYDDSKFYQCVHKNGKYFIGGSLQKCAEGLTCRNDGELECEEEIPKEYIIASNIEAFDANDIDHKLDEI
ncbi:uncharacterized protein LOC108906442 [Anoplophora glabripennis]|uniref:uncharacterized protein LOC108906442 n=1 Tax=Anoplophora glabripennis TaxID=217634 RepID=UPI000875567A|nr:uncharacterized protein LOC108906442 [Anoplophora glabripennis]